MKAEEDAKAAQRAKEEREEALRKEQEERDNSVNQQIKEDTGLFLNYVKRGFHI